MTTTKPTKVCIVCKQSKELNCFSKCCGYPDGLQASCRECQSIRWKEYKAIHGERIRARQREHHSKPEIKAKKSAQRTSEEGRARMRQYMANYRKKNRAKLYDYELKYNERSKANGGEFTESDRETLFAYYGRKCLACGSGKDLAADHVVPVSLGGSNGIENRQPLCRSCNSKKSDGTTDFRN